MRPSAQLEIEVRRPRNPLAPPSRGAFLSPTLLDSLLSMLPKRAVTESRSTTAHQVPSAPLVPLDLGFDPDELDADAAAFASAPPEDSVESDYEESANPSRPTTRKRAPRSVQERLRGLNAAEQQKIARSGEQTERVALERIYGKAVWENLLRNPKITPPEVARIARMGAVPQPIIETIVGNRAWLSSPQIRRALLQNRRLKSEMILSVLRATPKSELRLVPKQSAYSPMVREAAQKLIS